jgi:tetratricopeptide (TPR) repeat protein
MPDRAVQSYSHAVTLNPKNDESIINMGLAHCDVGNIDEAISCYNTAEERTGETAKLWYCKGNAYNKGRDHNKAVDCYSQAIKINPEYEDAWFNKGSALHLLGENKKAIECLNQVLHVNPYNESAREAIKICKDALTKNQ